MTGRDTGYTQSANANVWSHSTHLAVRIVIEKGGGEELLVLLLRLGERSSTCHLLRLLGRGNVFVLLGGGGLHATNVRSGVSGRGEKSDTLRVVVLNRTEPNRKISASPFVVTFHSNLLDDRF